ncbi:hypothetical protein HE1_00469 [Holospora elegans E1]|uniref:Uncharacterized protein n=1 Tax=Holospora elegans E1 TaxID=1427503 RepID=A0A023DYR6_9PROT|nr:hypothetical protein [Holospora elegans]GAJ46145.1 hypothetical protein HE1_00469 [Holospora elegans E1]
MKIRNLWNSLLHNYKFKFYIKSFFLLKGAGNSPEDGKAFKQDDGKSRYLS